MLRSMALSGSMDNPPEPLAGQDRVAWAALMAVQEAINSTDTLAAPAMAPVVAAAGGRLTIRMWPATLIPAVAVVLPAPVNQAPDQMEGLVDHATVLVRCFR